MRLFTAKHWVVVLLAFCALSAACVVWLASATGVSLLTALFAVFLVINVANTLFSIFVPLVEVEGRLVSVKIALFRPRRRFSLDDVIGADNAGHFLRIDVRGGTPVTIPQGSFTSADRAALVQLFAKA